MFDKISLVSRKLLKKIRNLIFSEINEVIFPYRKRIKNLVASYENVGFLKGRNFYLNSLNTCLSKLDFPKFDENLGMYSEHLIIFAAIANSNLNPINILEIGTHDGKTASILSILFPKSNITTIDLKDNDPIFLSTYNRNFDTKKFIEKRNQNLSKHENINFIQANSLYLSFSEELKGQDLIWIDGAHGYPIVSSDITNCLRLLKKSGILMCDDVWIKLNQSDKMYNSLASYETISSFNDIGALKTTYFLKRIGKKFNGNYKYVSLSKFRTDFNSNIK